MLLSGRTVLYLHGDGHENNGRKTDFEQIRQTRPSPGLSHITSPATSVCVISVQCNSTWGKTKNKNMFLNVCFKDSSSTFQVFGCFFLLRVKVHSFSRTFASPKKKKKRRRKKKTFYVLTSTHWAGKIITTAK